MFFDQHIPGFEDALRLSSLFERISGTTFHFQFTKDQGFGLFPIVPEGIKVGGIGVTDRSLWEIINHLDKSSPRKLSESIESSESIILIGNGLSLAPLELKKDYPEKRVAIVDMLEYTEMIKVYESNISSINSIVTRFPQFRILLPEYFKNARALYDAGNEGQIEIFRFTFGTGVPEFGTFDLGINCYGPPIETIAEQLRLINKNGELYYRGLDIGARVFTQSEI